MILYFLAGLAEIAGRLKEDLSAIEIEPRYC